MYTLSDKQVDYILGDISARGVEMESLRQNLLDHVCCIIEHDLEENGDFELFYQSTISTFYKHALWEIEEETISLLTFKNYYIMKKIMIVSGIISAVGMVLGLLFKFMHWPGASMFIVVGIATMSLVFLPLLFTLKAKEKQNAKDKLVIGIGAFSGILLSLSILFKIMHWPHANTMGMLSVLIMLAVFLPVYFLGGIRNPDTKVNTITMSIVIILVCGLVFTLIRTPRASRIIMLQFTGSFFNTEQIVNTEQQQLKQYLQKDSLHKASIVLSQQINLACAQLKSLILERETGYATIDADYEGRDALLSDHTGIDLFDDYPDNYKKVEALNDLIVDYNQVIDNEKGAGLKKIPVKAPSPLYYLVHGDAGAVSVLGLLNQLSQVQLFVLQNDRELLATK